MSRATHPWKPHHDQMLRDLYPDMTGPQVALQMGRSLKAIQRRAAKLGLCKSPAKRESAKRPRLVTPGTKMPRAIRADGRALGNQRLVSISLPGSPIHQPAQWKSEAPVTVAPVRGLAAGFDPRVQCDPNECVIGGFRSMGIGRYFDEAAA